MQVLVAYASEYGSTRDIAERVGAVLEDHGFAVAVSPVESVQSLDPVDAVVVGSAVHNLHWLADAEQFLERHRMALQRRPVWLFSVGMPAALRWPLRGVAGRREEASLLDELEAIAPRGHRLFSGVYERAHNPHLVGRAIFELVAGRYGDYRDWPAIDAWAHGIAHALPAPARRAASARSRRVG
jgi:menaquinone-dependent protoporphyrinogen oxidase